MQRWDNQERSVELILLYLLSSNFYYLYVIKILISPREPRSENYQLEALQLKGKEYKSICCIPKLHLQQVLDARRHFESTEIALLIYILLYVIPMEFRKKNIGFSYAKNFIY